MSEEKILEHPRGLYRTFDRKGGSAVTATHYCPGCGHGILHKLIGEALADLELQDRTIMVSPVGCSVFAYYYFDCGNVQAAHGRAGAVATGLSRAADHAVVIAYQGDGDLCSIGLNETFQAANRGEKIAVFFVNNAVYGMTGGQMAPTTLVGQKTATSPTGRDALSAGHPIHACELMNVLRAPVYIERCSLADAKRVRQARRAVRKALEIQKQGKGFTFVELLSPCPTALRQNSAEAARFLREDMEPEFPLGCLRDRSAEAESVGRPQSRFSQEDLVEAFSDYESSPGEEAVRDAGFARKRIRVAGFGGQGVLSLGLMLTHAGKAARRFVTWMPSYGPEQRGGTANCSVTICGEPVASPIFSESDVLVAMNWPSVQRFGQAVAAGGVIFYEASTGKYQAPAHVTAIAVPAREIAAGAGTAKAANTVMLGVLAASNVTELPDESFSVALAETLGSKATLLPPNLTVLDTAKDWAVKNIDPRYLRR